MIGTKTVYLKENIQESMQVEMLIAKENGHKNKV